MRRCRKAAAGPATGWRASGSALGYCVDEGTPALLPGRAARRQRRPIDDCVVDGLRRLSAETGVPFPDLLAQPRPNHDDAGYSPAMPFRETPGPASPVVVTGGGSGIGRATAVALAEWGRPLSLWGRHRGRLDETAEECRAYGVETHVLSIDVRDAEAIVQGVAATVDALGGVGGMVHSAGATRATGLSKFLTGEWDEIIETNLTAFAVLSKALVPHLRAHAPGSSVVLVASGTPGGFPAYAAAKAGAIGLMVALASKLAPEGIRFNAVIPGRIVSRMTAEVFADADAIAKWATANVPLGRTGVPEDLATPIRFLLSEEAGYITGLSIAVDGGMKACGRRGDGSDI